MPNEKVISNLFNVEFQFHLHVFKIAIENKTKRFSTASADDFSIVAQLRFHAGFIYLVSLVSSSITF